VWKDWWNWDVEHKRLQAAPFSQARASEKGKSERRLHKSGERRARAANGGDVGWTGSWELGGGGGRVAHGWPGGFYSPVHHARWLLNTGGASTNIWGRYYLLNLLLLAPL
jgi:hypothetical protein